MKTAIIFLAYSMLFFTSSILIVILGAIAIFVGMGRNVERNQESKRNLEVENTVRQVENSETCITLVNLWVKFPPLWQSKVKRQTANRHAESSVRR
jgi:p-aminobenzoyl-glutamate transporter AbgT